MESKNPSAMEKFANLLLLGMLLATPVALAQLAPEVAAQSTVGVSIHNYAFSPSVITVVIGVNNTITWTNNDPVTHTVTADDNSFSNTLSAGGTYIHTFTAAGTFTYHCTIHTYMTGTVKVLAPSGATTSSSTSSSGGIPEFPFEGIAIGVMTAVVLAAYVVVRQTRRK
jgi:plastocyanin